MTHDDRPPGQGGSASALAARRRSLPLVQKLAGGTVALSLALTLGACGVLPAAGPSSSSILSSPSAGSSKVSYALVEVTPAIIHLLRPPATTTLASLGGRRGRAAIRLGPGDVVSLSIFEASSGGLFIPTDAGSRPGNFISLPTVEVDQRGNLTVPYAGQVRAAGRTLAEVQDEIEGKLRNRAIDPQIVLAVQEQRSNRITVVGEVATPGMFALSAAGERVLDAIARAGGPRYDSDQTFVTLQRGGRDATMLYKELVQQPANNVWLQPGDTISIFRDTRTFITLGASGQGRLGVSLQSRFESGTMTLAEAIARAGGILDERGDPKGVYVYRLEKKKRLQQMGYDFGAYPEELVPTVYKVDLRDAGGIFLASKFSIADKDVVYLANAPIVDYMKFVDILHANLMTAREGALLVKDVRN
jgi:polysaccharide export outer membrane protein